tara:strand:+ start:330 stop:461 length:132 start_codon:yes stop_codon:yes gene_type:complete
MASSFGDLCLDSSGKADASNSAAVSTAFIAFGGNDADDHGKQN